MSIKQPPPVNPIVDLKLYNPQMAPKKEKPQFVSPFPYHIPVGGPYAMVGQLLEPLRYPVVNSYTINTSGPYFDYGKVNTIYEDMLPLREILDAFSTISERLNNSRFIRAILIKKGDGEEMSLDGRDRNNLLSYFKFLDMNPYKTDVHYRNPIRTLPKDMLLFRTVYPIKYSQDYGTIVCGNPSIGINVRIYKLLNSELKAKELKIDYKMYNVWRDISCYEYIREKILKLKVSPHFAIMHSYYISKNRTIDFAKINRMKEGFCAPNPPSYVPNKGFFQMDSLGRSSYVTELDPNPDADSGSCMIALTEGTTYSILGWATKTYQKDFNIKKMIHTGFHNDNVWASILFQFLHSLATLQKNKITYRNMSLINNFFIKDIALNPNSQGWWKYKLNGIDYYVPNYGYVLVVDSDYKDIENRPLLQPSNNNNNNNFKILAEMFGTDQKTIDQVMHENLKNLINTNCFNKSFTDLGGVMPSQKILNIIESISDDIKNSPVIPDISELIYKNMRQFMNNRIGTLLSQKEIPNIMLLGPKDFKKGDMVVYESGYDTYSWGLYVGETFNNDPDIGNYKQAIILTKQDVSDKVIIEKTLPYDSLYTYVKNEKIELILEPNEPKFNEEELLETYVL